MKLGRVAILAWALATPVGAGEGQVPGAIRLAPRERPPLVEEPVARRAFDHESFESRLESLWFRRRALLAQGRDHDAQRHTELILSFLAEEGVTELEPFASALLIEAQRALRVGDHEAALDAIEFADALDPGRPQVAIARAATLWQMGEGLLASLRELLRAWLSELRRGIEDLSLLPQVLLALGLALGAVLTLYAALLLGRYQRPLRHEIEEWCLKRGRERWVAIAGWLVVSAPLLLWVSAPWLAFYALAVTFRFMRSAERWVAGVLLVAVAASPAVFRGTVALYGVSADPTVRTVLDAARGGYTPERIVRVQALVAAHPDQPTYHFLLARLYADGRYFEEAYQHYRKVLELDPHHAGAYINIGNLFYRLGQYPEAIAAYRQAIECEPRSALAYFNLYVAQSEAFRFREAEESLQQAQALDREATARWLTERRPSGEAKLDVHEARIPLAAVWQGALAGRSPGEDVPAPDARAALAALWPNPVTLASLGLLVGFGVLGVGAARWRPARVCVRCGRPFCPRCRRGEHGEACCSQCLHLFVLADGLAPESKTRKLYEIARYEWLRRWSRRLASLLAPGAGSVLRGHCWSGVALLLMFVAAASLAWPEGALRLAAWAGVLLPREVFRPAAVPASFAVPALGFVGGLVALGAWLWANRWLLWRREV